MARFDISANKDAARVLKNMVIGIDGIKQVNSGDRIVYWSGDASDYIGQKAVGRMAYDLAMAGDVRLFQNVISEKQTELGPLRTFEYMAEVV